MHVKSALARSNVRRAVLITWVSTEVHVLRQMWYINDVTFYLDPPGCLAIMKQSFEVSLRAEMRCCFVTARSHG